MSQTEGGPAAHRGRPTGGSRGRTAQGQDSRERLLEAAIALISERGYAATSVDAICKRAGSVKTALYWHFENKEGLLAAVIERVANTWIEEIRKAAYLAEAPEERLDSVLSSFKLLVLERPQLMRLLLGMILERSDVSEPTRQALASVVRRAEAAIVQGIEDALGPMPDLDLVAHTLLALLQAAVLRLLVDPTTDVERLFSEFRRVVYLSLESRLRHTGRSVPVPTG